MQASDFGFGGGDGGARGKGAGDGGGVEGAACFEGEEGGGGGGAVLVFEGCLFGAEGGSVHDWEVRGERVVCNCRAVQDWISPSELLGLANNASTMLPFAPQVPLFFPVDFRAMITNLRRYGSSENICLQQLRYQTCGLADLQSLLSHVKTRHRCHRIARLTFGFVAARSDHLDLVGEDQRIVELINRYGPFITAR